MTIMVGDIMREVAVENGFECWVRGKLVERFASYEQAQQFANGRKNVTIKYKLLPIK